MARFAGTLVDDTTAPGPRFAGIPVNDTGRKPLKPKAHPTDLTIKGTRGMDPSENVFDQNGRQIYTSGILQNFEAGANNIIPDLVGGAVDRSRNVINYGIGASNFLTGKPLATNMLGDTALGTKWFHDLYGATGIRRPDEVVAKDPMQKVARSSGSALAATVLPEMALVTAAKTGAIPAELASKLAPLLGDGSAMGKTAVASTLAGAGGSVAEQVAPEPLKPLAATLGALTGGGIGATVAEIPTLARAGGSMAADWLAPITQGGRERLVGQQLRDSATSPGNLAEALSGTPDNLVPGSMPTVGQMSGDMGILGLERGVATKNPDAFSQRRADQNAARVDTINGLQQGGDPAAVVTALRGRLAQIDQQAEAGIAGARNTAQADVAALGAPMTPDVAGDTVRGAYEAARADAKAAERRLWQAVDPDNSLVLPLGETNTAARQIVRETPATAKPASAEEAAIFSAANKLGPTARLADITALQSRIKTELRAERIANGESPAYRRLAMLNEALQRDLEGAVTRRVQQEQQAVAAGQLSPENTLEARMGRLFGDVGANVQARAAGQDGGTATGPVSGGAASFTAGPSGAAVPSGGGLGNAPRLPGLSGDDLGSAAGPAAFDGATLGRLNDARGATRQRVETFDNKTLGPLRRRPTSTAPYDIPSSAVVPRLFSAGPKSFDAINAYRRAVGDQRALDAMEGYAVDRLLRTALRDDGTLDPAKVATWRRQNSDALRAFPELDARIQRAASSSEALGQAVAAARQNLDREQMGNVGKLLGTDDPEQVANIIGTMLSRQDAAGQLLNLRAKLGKNSAGLEGLRKAVAGFIAKRFVSNTEAGTSGLGTVRSDAFQTFVREKRGALRAAGFTDDEIGTMERLAADLQRSDRSISAVKLPGGSNTAQDTLAAGKSGETSLAKIILAGFLTGGSLSIPAGPLGWTAGAAVSIVGYLRSQGIRQMEELLRDALLDPTKARLLLMKVKPATAKQAASTFTKTWGRAALTGAATSMQGGK